MGGDWYWGGVKSSSSAAAVKKGRGRGNRQSYSATAPSGCINTVLHLLDFHHFQFGIRVSHDREPSSSPLNGLASSPLLLEELAPPKGTEAPRNSLELEQAPFPMTHHYDRDYENLNIPMGIQIRTSLDQRAQKSGAIHDFTQEIDSSPGGNRTPTLVARLMGLDILPASCSSSPRISSTSEVMPPYSEPKLNCPHNRIRKAQMHQGRRSCGSDTETMNCGGTRSLPETPRVSLARRSTEATADHRLSLQIINKENSNSSDEFNLSRFRTLLRRKEAKIRELEENRSPSYSARQFAKPATDKVGRKVGVDITNAVKNREREILVNHIKSKQESSFPFSSPKIQNQNSNKKSRSFVVDVPKLIQGNRDHHLKSILERWEGPISLYVMAHELFYPMWDFSMHQLLTLEEEPQAKQQKCSQRRKKPAIIVDERFDLRLKKPVRTLSPAVRNQQEEASLFVHRPSPSSTQAKSGSNIPDKKCNRKSCPLPAKKDPSPPTTKIPQKQQQVHDSTHTTRQCSTCLPSLESSNRSAPGQARHRLVNHDKPQNWGDWSKESLTFYISRVLKRCCSPEESDILSSSTNFKQFSGSHAIDPSMFRLLELETNLADCMNGHLSYRCNRKLLFDLLDEILADICSDSARCNGGSRMVQVFTRELCSTIMSFPSADCQYLEDVDRLIEGDMAKSKGSEEEGAVLALEIEEDIMDKLIRETAMACGVTFT